ncbi:MAG: MBL fold metallo-hydrolase [Pseudomonadota bacterium]
MSRIEKSQVGDFEVIALTDGGAEFGAEIFPGTEEAQIKTLLGAAGVDTIQTNFNAFLIKSGDDVVLVDAGPRDLFGDTCGFLQDAMGEAGVGPDDVTHLMVTHLHPDHVAGMITADGGPVFGNATMFVGEEDHAFWGKETFTDETMQQWQGLAQAALAAYADKTEQFSGESEIVKGVWTQHLAGHTPGHYGFRIDGGSAGLMHVGDIAHAQHLQFADPDIGTAFDVDPDTARKTRKSVLDMVATDELLFTGGHMLKPKFGHLTRVGNGYAFEPE